VLNKGSPPVSLKELTPNLQATKIIFLKKNLKLNPTMNLFL